MIDIKGVAHFSIPVSDVERSKRFYTDIVGCKHLATIPPGNMVFLDAGGVCLILVKHEPPINRRLDDHNGVHHSFIVDSHAYKDALAQLKSKGVEITFEEDRQGGIVNGPRAYFRDPDGTVLEFIDLTSYAGSKLKAH
jgi:catechol 2,3-dioxygenase-like lactoylglutathione lyase family enzyme